MSVILNGLGNSAIAVLNTGARILKPVLYYAQKEKDVFIKAKLSQDAQKTLGELAKKQGLEAVKKSASIGAILSTVNGVWMSAFYIWNNNRSKKIPEERKKTLNLNIIITTLLALGTGVVLTPVMGHFARGLQSKVSGKAIIKSLSPKNVEKIVEQIKTNKELIGKAVNCMPELAQKPVEEIAKKYAPTYVEGMTKEGIRSIVDLMYITAAFRLVGPIIATPLAEKANQFLAKHNFTKSPDKKEQTPTTSKIA